MWERRKLATARALASPISRTRTPALQSPLRMPGANTLKTILTLFSRLYILHTCERRRLANGAGMSSLERDSLARLM